MPGVMLALQLDPAPRMVQDAPAPEPGPGEALIRLRLAGICDTDLQLAKGYMGFRGIPGHEFVGEVVECDQREWIGRRVVGDINASCGSCEDCNAGNGHHCARRTVLGILGRSGCLAEQFALPTRNLVQLPDELSDEDAVFAEPLAAGQHVLDEVRGSGAHGVAILGDGKLGLLTALALRASGVEVTVIGHHASKLVIAGDAGMKTLLEEELDDPLTDSSFDLVVEATGNPGGLSRAFNIVRPRGTVVLKTTVADPGGLDLSPVVINELRLIGSRCGDMTQAVSLLTSGNVSPGALIAMRYQLSQAPRALEHAAQRGVLKVLVEGP